MSNINRIKDALSRRPFHRLIKNDVYGIAERIKDIDPDYFILYNLARKKFEVHNTSNIGDTYCFTVQDRQLDYRALRHCRETSVGRNMLAVYEKSNDRIDASKEKSRSNLMHDMAEDLADRMIHANASDSMREGYSKYHIMK